MSQRGRFIAALLPAMLIGLGAPADVSAGLRGSPVEDRSAERAAREITAARARANDLADQLWIAQSRAELLRESQVQVRAELDVLQLEVDGLQALMEAIAVSRFVAAGGSGIPLLTDVRAPNDRMQVDVFTGIIADAGANTMDQYEALRTELAETRLVLQRSEADSVSLQMELERLRAEAEDEVSRLRQMEEQRLHDEAVQRALEAQRREEIRRAEAQALADEAARLAAQDAAAPTGPAPATASGSTVGGRTGGGGGGSNPGSFAESGFVDSMVCPVRGSSAYGDTWGAPRSGGRRHQGVDMLAPVGTPLQAVVSGLVEHRSNPLGGITVSLRGDNGNRYYYAHLDAYEGAPGRYEQGQILGYMGDTGNAYGTPHLHFEIRPNGGVPVNPTPSVRAAGC